MQLVAEIVVVAALVAVVWHGHRLNPAGGDRAGLLDGKGADGTPAGGGGKG